jgi:uncharacterized protein YbjT (DUF2867 family)
MGYYRVKTEQERVVEQGPVPWTIVRITQFHELVAGILGGSRVLPLPRVRLQTVAAREAATAVADVAERPASRGRVTVTGPETSDVRELARQWRRATGRTAVHVPVLLPGALWRALRSGVLTSEHPDVRGTTTFSQWLAEAAR